MGNDKANHKRGKIQEHRREARTNQCSILHSENRVSVEELAKRFSDVEDSIQLLS